MICTHSGCSRSCWSLQVFVSLLYRARVRGASLNMWIRLRLNMWISTMWISSLLRSWRWWGCEDDQTVRWRWTMLALSPLDRMNKRMTAVGPVWPARALLQLCGRDRRVWSALRGACDMLVWWSPWHGGVNGAWTRYDCAVFSGPITSSSL